MALRAVLPEHHRSPDSRDRVKLGMGLIATILEMDKPYEGIIRFSSAPLAETLAQLGK